MEDFQYCIWLTSSRDYPWNGFIEGVPAHLTIASHLQTLREAEDLYATIHEGARIRLHGGLELSSTSKFHALVREAACEDGPAPAWWPPNPHVSFAYAYDPDECQSVRGDILRQLWECPEVAPLTRLCLVKATGHYKTWKILRSGTVKPLSPGQAR